MRRATSLQTPPHPYAHARPTATVAVNGIAMGGMVCAHGEDGRGNLRIW